MAPSLSGKSVLVSGGTGSFGNAFVRRALSDGAKKVVIFSRDEAKQAAMCAAIADDRARFILGDIRDAKRVRDACRGIDTVIHAAALKRVDSGEANPWEFAATNVTGTINVAAACIERGVQNAVFLSTDKAAAPATLYGASKLMAERLWNASNAMSAGTGTRFASTRYGNVLASTGSVIPRWRMQSDRGEALNVTNLHATRFWMPMTAALDLVLLALGDMRRGATYIPKLHGAPLWTLLDAIAPDSAVALTGLQVGEKMHECLVTEDESPRTYDCDSHYLIEPPLRTWGDDGPVAGTLVAPGFVYESDAAIPFTADELRALVAA